MPNSCDRICLHLPCQFPLCTALGKSGLFETVTMLLDGGKAPAVLAIELQLLAQAADVRIHRARGNR